MRLAPSTGMRRYLVAVLCLAGCLPMEGSPDPAAFDQPIPRFATSRAEGVCADDEAALHCVMEAQAHYLRAFGEEPTDLERNAVRLEQRILDVRPVEADRLLAVNDHLLVVGRLTRLDGTIEPGRSCLNCHVDGSIP